MIKHFCYFMMLLIVLALVFAFVSKSQTQPVKFALSTEESLRLENLHLRKQLLVCQAQGTSRSIDDDAQRFAANVLKAHGNPPDVTFDPEAMQFRVKIQESK